MAIEKSGEKKPPENKTSATTFGLNIAAGMAFFTYAGHLLDRKFGKDFLVIIGACLGLLYCAYELWKVIREINKS